MCREWPSNSADLLQFGSGIQADLRAFKSKTALLDYGWYPYESLSALPLVAELIAPAYEELTEVIRTRPVADLGCADGDWAILFSMLGASVDAIDHRESNFNQMRGIDTLRQAFAASIQTHDVDLDAGFTLPRASYGLSLFLGTLYHLKNPYNVFERLASYADWCVMSTRIAQVTANTHTRIAAEPVAYLLGAREANNDPTNFWIFSLAGLTRILERTGWMIVTQKRVGCLVDSDPVHAQADERVFMLLKSRTRNPELHVRPLEGWFAIEEGQWCWTAKQFSIEVTLPTTQSASEFALRITVPEAVSSAVGAIRLSCQSDNTILGALSCDAAETIEFRGSFPNWVVPGSTLRLDFTVESSYRPSTGDTRDLGVIVPLLDSTHRLTHRIPFRIS